VRRRSLNGPTADQFQEFSRLLEARQPELWSIKPTDTGYELLTAELREHPVHRWLARSEPYSRAVEIFHKSARRCYLLRHVDDIQFIATLTHLIGPSIRAVEIGLRPIEVRKGEMLRAAKLAFDLVALMDSGRISLDEWSDTKQLRRLLGALHDQLNKPGKRGYSGNALPRAVFTQIAEDIFLHDLKAAAVVNIIEQAAELYPFQVSRRSVQRYVRAASDNHSEPVRRQRGDPAMPAIRKRRQKSREA
jgi:hypothetical protein